MNPPIKKLTVLFLICAILTSSLAFGVSAFINRTAVKDKSPQQGSVGDAASGYKIYGAGPNGKNLTDEATSIFARQLVEANPQGPQQNQDGSVQLFSPTSTELFSYLAANAPSEDVLKPPVDESRVQVIQNFDVSDVSHYLSEVARIQNDITSNPIWQAAISTTTVSATTPMDLASETAKMLTTAQNDMYATKVPAPFVPLHKSLIAFFSTAASFSNMVIQDPVAAMALSNSLDKIVIGQNADMQRALKDIQTSFPGLLSVLPQENRSTLADILGIRVAYAIVLNFDAANFGEWLTKFWKEYKDEIIANALGFLKNALMKKISQKIIEWAQGAGVPGYVTNWVMFEASTAFDAKVGLISRKAAKLCGNAATAGFYGDLISSALGAARIEGQPPPVGEPVGCPRADSGFYSVGGYDPNNFLNLMTNNTYNDILRLKDESLLAAAAASQASVNEAMSGRGSLDVKKCDDGSTPGAIASSTETVDDSFVGPILPPNSRCADGSAARTVTPGSAKQELISKALGGTQDIIAGVNNEHMYSAVIQVLENAVLTYVFREGEGIFSGSAASGNPPPPPPPGGEFRILKNWYVDQLTSALSNTNGAISIYRTAIGGLETALASCQDPLVAPTIQGLIDGFQASVDALTAVAASIQVKLTSAQAAENEAALLNIGTSGEITALATQASTNNTRAQTDLESVGELLRTCNPTGGP